MQALKERISSKLSEKSKSKDKDASAALKPSSSADGKHSTLQDSHHAGATASSGSPSASAGAAAAASSTAIHIQSAEKGIAVSRVRKENRRAFAADQPFLITFWQSVFLSPRLARVWNRVLVNDVHDHRDIERDICCMCAWHLHILPRFSFSLTSLHLLTCNEDWRENFFSFRESRSGHPSEITRRIRVRVTISFFSFFFFFFGCCCHCLWFFIRICLRADEDNAQSFLYWCTSIATQKRNLPNSLSLSLSLDVRRCRIHREESIRISAMPQLQWLKIVLLRFRREKQTPAMQMNEMLFSSIGN